MRFPESGEMNFAFQGGDKSPHSKSRARSTVSHLGLAFNLTRKAARHPKLHKKRRMAQP